MGIQIKESYTTAVISTAHIAKEDTELLTDASYNPRTDSGRSWTRIQIITATPMVHRREEANCRFWYAS
ncbi:hypothetical protein OQA82_27970, partial [Klebsiella pneumoniae]|nr:hypothetical protein [Klebsiella pneumoniae]